MKGQCSRDLADAAPELCRIAQLTRGPAIVPWLEIRVAKR
jgi:hypothetical protein